MKQRFSQVWLNLFQFVKKPVDGRYPNNTNLEKFKDVLCLVVIQFILLIPASMIVGLMEEFGDLNLPDHKLQDLFKEVGYGAMFFLAVILAPFLEELIFRTFITFRRFYPLLFFIDSGSPENHSKRVRKSLNIWSTLFPVMVYGSTFVFGYVHVFNFDGDIALWKAPFAVLPQLILGLTLAFTRVRYGLVWSMLNHAIWNLIPTVIFIFFPNVME